jgi:ankyrin repeat protein
VQSAYLIATSEGFFELLELTLAHGADVDAKDSFNGTGLIRAADRGHADIAGRVVRAGVDVDHVNNLGWTALHEAVTLGDGSQRYVDTVRVLVAAGANVRQRSSRDGATPLSYARSKGFDRVATVLQAALDADRPSRRQANQRLLAAAEAGDATAAAMAVRAGADLETRDGRGRTPLLLAVTVNKRAVAKLSVYLGADPDALDDRHDTPWLVTGVTGSVEMAEVLLPARPDLTIRNRFGGVSLIPASERGHVAYVRRVVRTDIDVNHVNDLGWTALLEAVILGDGSMRYQEIVAILLKAGADRNLPDRNGVTAIDHARRRGHTSIVDILTS